MCQLRVGDEVLTVNRHQVAEMSYLDWKSSMEEALQEGSLVMDVRRHGQNSELSGGGGWAGGSLGLVFNFEVLGLAVLLSPLGLLNTFDTFHWCANCCEIIQRMIP